jgi:hypothetical protein
MGRKANKLDQWCRNLTDITVGDYTLIKYIGQGKIGYVYLAKHRSIEGVQRAVKLVFDSLKSGWQNEISKVMQLELIEGVVHYHHHGTETIVKDGESHLAQYTVWDYIPPGQNLRDYLSDKQYIDVSFLFAVIDRVLRVLQAVDEKGVKRHGDLHSGNILIGDDTTRTLDDYLQPRMPIFVSDFGYGGTGAQKTPKDDYAGLATIINEMIDKVDYVTCTVTDRNVLKSMRSDFGKLLNEKELPERQSPLELLQVLNNIKCKAQTLISDSASTNGHLVGNATQPLTFERPNVGFFQVSEMIGDRWDWWKRLFVPTVPARSKILTVDIPTVVTGPRGCGKTMLFRRLSERLVLECGDVEGVSTLNQFAALYVNANDFADAFARFPKHPTAEDEARLICYANLCILSDLLAVLSARACKNKEQASNDLLALFQTWLGSDEQPVLVTGEDRLEKYRTSLERIKWKFSSVGKIDPFPGYHELSQLRWLPYLAQKISQYCQWMTGRAVMLFVDDYSTPRVSTSMQRVLNRLFLQRSQFFLAKVATEASTTFVPEDSSGKQLQDGDDYQLVDFGEESLFLNDKERLYFLNEVFSRRLPIDPRIPTNTKSLKALLGQTELSKTEFARRLRGIVGDTSNNDLRNRPIRPIFPSHF